MKIFKIGLYALPLLLATSCKQKSTDDNQTQMIDSLKNITFESEKFADIEVLHYDIPGWDKLTLKEKKLVYYLAQAGYSGRDIYWDQNYRFNLKIRAALENIYTTCYVARTSDEWKGCEVYLIRV